MEGTTTRPARMLTVAQVAERIGCSNDKAYELVRAKVFPGARRLDPGKDQSPWRVPVTDVEAYIAGSR